MENVKVKNMTSARGKTVPNQFIITTEDGQYFQSYESVIAFIPQDLGTVSGTFQGSELYPHIILDATYWDYSTTTGKYRNQFLGEDKAATERKIKSGEYV